MKILKSNCHICGVDLLLPIEDNAPKEAFLNATEDLIWKSFHHCDYLDPVRGKMITPLWPKNICSK